MGGGRVWRESLDCSLGGWDSGRGRRCLPWGEDGGGGLALLLATARGVLGRLLGRIGGHGPQPGAGARARLGGD